MMLWISFSIHFVELCPLVKEPLKTCLPHKTSNKNNSSLENMFILCCEHKNSLCIISVIDIDVTALDTSLCSLS